MAAMALLGSKKWVSFSFSFMLIMLLLVGVYAAGGRSNDGSDVRFVGFLWKNMYILAFYALH